MLVLFGSLTVSRSCGCDNLDSLRLFESERGQRWWWQGTHPSKFQEEVTRSFKVLLSMVWSFAVSLLAMFDIHKISVSCVVV